MCQSVKPVLGYNVMGFSTDVIVKKNVHTYELPGDHLENGVREALVRKYYSYTDQSRSLNGYTT